MFDSKLVNVEYLRKQRDKEAKTGKISSSCSGKEILEQQIEKRKKMRCSCGNIGTVFSRGDLVGYCGSGENDLSMCPECNGRSSRHYIIAKHPAGGIEGWFDYKIRLW